MRLVEGLALLEVAVEEETPPRIRNPVHVLEGGIHADADPVARVVDVVDALGAELERRIRGVRDAADALQVEDSVPGVPAALDADPVEAAHRAELRVVREEGLVRGLREAGRHDAVAAAAEKAARGGCAQKRERKPSSSPASRPRHHGSVTRLR